MYKFSQPVPHRKSPVIEGICIRDAGEPLICLEQLKNSAICYDPRYYQSGIPGATQTCFLRKGAAERLEAALKLLPAGYGFKIFDAWRPYAVQKFLFDGYFQRLRSKHPDMDFESLARMTKTFVSYPSQDPMKPFVHSTGGAIDLTIIDEAGNELEMGGGFDDFAEHSNTDYFETHPVGEKVRKNRRLLYNVMLQAGFTNLPSEWWHYDYGTLFWAYYSSKEALYPGKL